MINCLWLIPAKDQRNFPTNQREAVVYYERDPVKKAKMMIMGQYEPMSKGKLPDSKENEDD